MMGGVRRRNAYGNITNLDVAWRRLCSRPRHPLQVSYLAVSQRRHDFEWWQADADRRVCSVRCSMVLHFRDRLHFRLTDLVGRPSQKEKDMSTSPIQPTARNPAMASQLHSRRHWRGIGEPGRSAAWRALGMIESAFTVVGSLRSLRSLWLFFLFFTAENTESAESLSLERLDLAGHHGGFVPVGR